VGKWFGLAALFVVHASSALALDACHEEILHLRGDWGNAQIAVSVADTAESRSKGLMFVEDLPTMSGMLFVYDRAQSVSFWMKNTLIPLDMIFADATGVVRKVHENAVPGDLTGIPGGANIQFVLELNGGMADRLGIGPGTEMRHPAIPDEIAGWPCAS